jgi:hypothetical protein
VQVNEALDNKKFKNMRLLKLTTLTFIIFASFSSAKAQAPINDNCNGALNINSRPLKKAFFKPPMV